MPALEDRIKERARLLGFDLVGIAPAAPSDGFGQLRAWLARGFAGTMDYMHRHQDARRHPASILPAVRSIIMVGMNYHPESSAERRASPLPPTAHFALPSADRPLPAGKIARYARGLDYHDVLRARLKQLLAWVEEQVPGTTGRGVVDTAPLLERDFARRAGLGWFGKNTMLINKKLGSYFFLGALLLDIELQADAPFGASHCGSCTACLDACPTQAFVAPGQLDSRRCISYLTIELRGPVEPALRPGIGDWVFGCDVCQEVCPWNRKAPPATEPAFQSRADLEAIDLIELLGMSEEDFRRRFRGTALLRAKRSGLIRNAALVLANSGNGAALPALKKALADPDPIIRDAAQWAIVQITGLKDHGESCGSQ